MDCFRYLALQQSTGLIQQRWRDKLAARQQHQNYLNMKASAVAIQALWRGHRDRLRIHKVLGLFLLIIYY